MSTAPILVQVQQNADGSCPQVTVQFVPYVAPPPPPAPKGNPQAAFSVTGVTDAGTITLQDQSTDSGGTINAWAWVLDGVQVSTVQNPTLTGVAAGNHTLFLTVTDDTGQSSTATTQTVSVPSPPVQAPPPNGPNGDDVGAMQAGDTYTPPGDA